MQIVKPWFIFTICLVRLGFGNKSKEIEKKTEREIDFGISKYCGDKCGGKFIQGLYNWDFLYIPIIALYCQCGLRQRLTYKNVDRL